MNRRKKEFREMRYSKRRNILDSYFHFLKKINHLYDCPVSSFIIHLPKIKSQKKSLNNKYKMIRTINIYSDKSNAEKRL